MNIHYRNRFAKKWIAMIGAALGTAAMANPPLPSIPSATFNVTSYGASGNGSTDDTNAIQDAINAAQSAGGGSVIIPSGTFLSNPLKISEGSVNLEVNGILRAQPYGTYSEPTKNFIAIDKVSNVEVSGTGTIDGQGNSGWWTTGEAGTRPHDLDFDSCSTVEVAVEHVVNSPKEHITFEASNDVTITGVTVSAASSSANTDGIDPAGNDYYIKACNISDGDDNMAIKPENVSCSSLTITNCTFGSGHGLSVGGETNDGLNGLVVNNCQFNGTQYGIRLKADRGDGGVTQNCTCTDLSMNGVEYPIYISSYYDSFNPVNTNSNDNPPVPDTSDAYTAGKTPVWTNITFSSVQSVDNSPGSYAGLIWGIPEELVQNVTLNAVKLTSYYGMVVNYATGVDFTNGCAITVSSGTAFSNPIGNSPVTNLYDASIENAP